MLKLLKLALIALALNCVPAAADAQVSLRGTPRSMAYQNKMADRLDLTRIDERQLKAFKKNGLLVRLPKGKHVKIDPRLPDRYRWCRPWTRSFVSELGRRFHDRFGKPLKINSAVRTIEYQLKLSRTNGNAARGHNPLSWSSHLTGATIDIAKKGLTPPEIQWLRARLRLNEKVNRAEVTEEFNQAVFHVMVLR